LQQKIASLRAGSFPRLKNLNNFHIILLEQRKIIVYNTHDPIVFCWHSLDVRFPLSEIPSAQKPLFEKEKLINGRKQEQIYSGEL
jgi:hypothetical protein